MGLSKAIISKNTIKLMYKLNYKTSEGNREINMVNQWDEVTISQFIEFQQILEANISDTYKAVNLISVFTGEEVSYLEELPIVVYKKLYNQLDFISTNIPTIKYKNEYILNGNKYMVNADITGISTAQYIDYQAYSKEGNLIDMMSLWLIPEGHSYGDGYDLKKVKKDISQMKLIDVRAVSFFFRVQLAAFILIMKDYSKKELKKEMSKKDIRQLEIRFNNMASSLLS